MVKVALWIMSVFSFRQCGKGSFVDHVCFQAVVRVALWIMFVFRQCGKGGFVDHVCSDPVPLPGRGPYGLQ